MKRFAAAVIAVLLVSSQPVGAAPKTIAANEITKVAAIAVQRGGPAAKRFVPEGNPYGNLLPSKR